MGSRSLIQGLCICCFFYVIGSSLRCLVNTYSYFSSQFIDHFLRETVQKVKPSIYMPSLYYVILLNYTYHCCNFTFFSVYLTNVSLLLDSKVQENRDCLALIATATPESAKTYYMVGSQ